MFNLRNKSGTKFLDKADVIVNALVTEPVGKGHERVLYEALHRVVQMNQAPGLVVTQVWVDLWRQNNSLSTDQLLLIEKPFSSFLNLLIGLSVIYII